jgi:type 1 fimbria pilin
MLRRSLVAVIVLVVAGAAFAAGEGREVKLNGYIIDNMCASAHPNDLAETAKGHPTACATMPNCLKSGYSVVADGTQYKLDEEGNKKVVALLKGGKSKKGFAVVVEGTVEGETLRVKKIAVAES